MYQHCPVVICPYLCTSEKEGQYKSCRCTAVGSSSGFPPPRGTTSTFPKPETASRKTHGKTERAHWNRPLRWYTCSGAVATARTRSPRAELAADLLFLGSCERRRARLDPVSDARARLLEQFRRKRDAAGQLRRQKAIPWQASFSARVVSRPSARLRGRFGSQAAQPPSFRAGTVGASEDGNGDNDASDNIVVLVILVLDVSSPSPRPPHQGEAVERGLRGVRLVVRALCACCTCTHPTQCI